MSSWKAVLPLSRGPSGSYCRLWSQTLPAVQVHFCRRPRLRVNPSCEEGRSQASVPNVHHAETPSEQQHAQGSAC